MYAIFFWVLMLLWVVTYGWLNRNNWPGLGAGLIVWLAVLLLGLHVYPFHG